MFAEPKYVYGITSKGLAANASGSPTSKSAAIRTVLASSQRLLTIAQISDRLGYYAGSHVCNLVQNGHVSKTGIESFKEQVAEFLKERVGGFSSSQLGKYLGDALPPGVTVASLLQPHIESGRVRAFGQACDGSPRWQCSAAVTNATGGPVSIAVSVPNHDTTETLKTVEAALSSGRKFDAEKPAMHLLPWDAVDAVADVMTYGAVKYGERNWEDDALSQERILAGGVRHVSQHLQGKKVDESGRLHLAHAAASALMALAKELRNGGA